VEALDERGKVDVPCWAGSCCHCLQKNWRLEKERRYEEPVTSRQVSLWY